MKNETKRIIQESKKWTATSEDIEDLSEELLFQNTIGKDNYQLDEEIIPTEYFALYGTELNYFPREL